MTTTLSADPRPAIAQTQEWIAHLLAGVTPAHLALPTPCTEFDVAQLAGHLYGVVDRLEAMGHGQPADSVPSEVDELPEDLAAGFRERSARAQAAWADDDALSRVVVAPFGPLPGAQVIGVYVAEQLAHGWDLAVATGQPAEAPDGLAEVAEQAIRPVLDPLPRGGVVPFEPATESAPGSGATERLANYLGRSRPAA